MLITKYQIHKIMFKLAENKPLMSFNEIIIGILIFIIAILLSLYFKTYHKNKYHNDSFRNRNK